MTTLRQIAANKANAQHSTGPRTAEGKERSSQNATKHGLTATRTLVGNEDANEYQQLRDGLYRDYAPANFQEEVLVDRIVSASWRTLRSRQMEQTLGNMSIEQWQSKRKADEPRTAKNDTEALVISMINDDLWQVTQRYDTQISRDFFRSVAALQRMQNDRFRQERQDRKDAEQLLRQTPQTKVKSAAANQNWVPIERNSNAQPTPVNQTEKAPQSGTPSLQTPKQTTTNETPSCSR